MEEENSIIVRSYQEFLERISGVEQELYDPEECEEILSKIRSHTLETFVEILEERKEEDIAQQMNILTKRMNERIHELLEKNNSRFWYVENTLDEIIDSVLTTYKNNVAKRWESWSQATNVEVVELLKDLEKECLYQYDHKASSTPDLPLTEVQINRHQLRKEIQDLAEEFVIQFKEEKEKQFQETVASKEDKARRIISDKLNRYTSQFDIVSQVDFDSELAKIRKSTTKQMENEMFIDNEFDEQTIFKIIDKLEISLRDCDYGRNVWVESIKYSNKEGEEKVLTKMEEMKQSYHENLNARRAHRRKVFVKSEKTGLINEFLSDFSFSDNDDKEHFRQLFESELMKVEEDVALNSIKGLVFTEISSDEYL